MASLFEIVTLNASSFGCFCGITDNDVFPQEVLLKLSKDLFLWLLHRFFGFLFCRFLLTLFLCHPHPRLKLKSLVVDLPLVGVVSCRKC